MQVFNILQETIFLNIEIIFLILTTVIALSCVFTLLVWQSKRKKERRKEKDLWGESERNRKRMNLLYVLNWNSPSFSLYLVIAQSNVDDVRPILDFYRSEEDVVAAFRRNQELLLKQQEEILQAQKQQNQAGGGFFSKGLFGRVSAMILFHL